MYKRTTEHSPATEMVILFPFILVLITPAVIMGVLYCRVRKQAKSKEIAKSVATQCGVYLLGLYWTYFFRIVASLNFLITGKTIIAINILANVVESSQGVWIMLTYMYFRSVDPERMYAGSKFLTNFSLSIGFGRHRRISFNRSCRRNINVDGETALDEPHDDINTTTKINSENLRGSSLTQQAPVPSGWKVSDRKMKETSRRSLRGTSNSSSNTLANRASALKPQFSIFDGFSVDPDSPWAEFLVDDVGEDDDYMNDCEYNDGENFVLKGASSRKLPKDVESKDESNRILPGNDIERQPEPAQTTSFPPSNEKNNPESMIRVNEDSDSSHSASSRQKTCSSTDIWLTKD